MDLVSSGIPITDHHLVKGAVDVISRSCFGVSVGVDSVVVGGSVGALLLKNDEILIVAVPAVDNGMAFLLAQLVLDLGTSIVGASTATATIVAMTTSLVAITPTIATTSSTMGRDVGRSAIGALPKIHALFEKEQLGVEISEGDRLHTSEHCKNDRIILNVESCDDVGDKILIIQGLACCRHLVGECTHLPDVLGNGKCSFRTQQW